MHHFDSMDGDEDDKTATTLECSAILDEEV